ncbi:MAG: PQQ-binding-like beta-propeller repeat protein [Planctomycetaceae bacterium]
MRSQRLISLTRRRFLPRGVSILIGAAHILMGLCRVASATEPATASRLKDAWPNFRNGLSLQGIAHTTLSPKPQLMWERETADGCKSTPAIVEGRVYVGQLSGDLQSLNLSDGQPQWTYRSLTPQNPKEFIPGFNGPVTVSGEVVICGDEEGKLHCVDRQTGQARWVFDAGGLIVGGAAVIGERVICGSHSQFLYGIHLKTGEKLWEFDCQGPVNGTQAFDGDYTFVSGCSEPVLYVVDTRTGEEHARIPLDDLLIATPAMIDGVLYFGTSEGLVLAVDWKTQATLARFETRQPREVHSAPAVTQDLVIIGGRDKSVYGLNRKTLEKQWVFNTRAGNDGSPVVVGDRVFIGSGDKFLYGLSLMDGTEVWKYGAAVSFADSSPAVAEGRMVVCTEGPSGKILCFK